MIIDVVYPSGNQFTAHGAWVGRLADNGELMGIAIDLTPTCGGNPDGSILLGDLRGVYRNRDTEALLYAPNILDPTLPKWVQGWLKDNPEWPPGS